MMAAAAKYKAKVVYFGGKVDSDVTSDCKILGLEISKLTRYGITFIVYNIAPMIALAKKMNPEYATRCGLVMDDLLKDSQGVITDWEYIQFAEKADAKKVIIRENGKPTLEEALADIADSIVESAKRLKKNNNF